MSKMNEKEHDYKFEMGQRLREMRENNALGQKELAEAVHVGNKQYQRYEYGTAAISCYQLFILEEKYHFDSHYILTGKKSREVDIDSYVINMGWNDKCSFFERMARYEVRVLKESKRKEKH